MDHIITFVENWGYVAVLLGSMIEGESVILTASFFAYKGILSLPKVMIIAFLGTLFADQALYFVGRHYGPNILKKKPGLQEKADKAFRLLHRWDIWFILSFRFIYGIRIISPIVIGASGLHPYKFTPLNLVAAIVWTILSCGGGYLLGETVEVIIENFHIVQNYILGFVGLIIIIIYLYFCLFRHKIIQRKKSRLNVEKNSSYEEKK